MTDRPHKKHRCPHCHCELDDDLIVSWAGSINARKGAKKGGQASRRTLTDAYRCPDCKLLAKEGEVCQSKRCQARRAMEGK